MQMKVCQPHHEVAHAAPAQVHVDRLLVFAPHVSSRAYVLSALKYVANACKKLS
jgi:hypothetical protein